MLDLFPDSARSDGGVLTIGGVAATELAAVHGGVQAAPGEIRGSFGIGHGRLDVPAALAWLAVGLPMLWGVWITLRSVLALFRY